MVGMRGAERTGPAIDLAAVASGVLWGMLLLLASAVVLGVVESRFTPSPAAEAARTLFLQAVAAGLAGLRSGWLTGRAGFLHGLLAGIGLVVATALVIGVFTDLPSIVGLAKGLLVGAGAGALAGIAAVNLGRR
jgi:putative membrane protein (TIGR04086 family)